MDIIIKKAEQFAKQHLSRTVQGYQEVLDIAKRQAYEIDNKGDRIKYLTYLLEQNNKAYSGHLPKCTNPIDCPENYGHESIAYFLKQELNRLGVHFDDDTFTISEMNQSESKLDQILRDLLELKNGQQIIYEDLLKEINEMRDLYYLGKKKWYQLLLGKSTDMVVSGVVSETISKQIIEAVKPHLGALLGP